MKKPSFPLPQPLQTSKETSAFGQQIVSNMKLTMMFSLFATGFAVDYRAGCASLPTRKHFENNECVQKISTAMELSASFIMEVDENNIDMLNQIVALANQHDYEFSKSSKTKQALERVAKNVYATMKEWAKTGAENGAQLGFAVCFAMQLLDNPKCLGDPFCHTLEATMDSLKCGALGYLGGGLYGGAAGIVGGFAKGFIEAYEEHGQIHISFNPAGRDF